MVALSMSYRVPRWDSSLIFHFLSGFFFSSYREGSGSHLIITRCNKEGCTLSNAQLCKMSFSYEEDEGETSSLWCKSLNFFMTSSTFKNTNNHVSKQHMHKEFPPHNRQELLTIIMSNNMYAIKQLLTSLDCGQMLICNYALFSIQAQ